MTSSLAECLDNHKDHLSITSNNRIVCALTGHEMPCDVRVVEAYLRSHKFKKMNEWYFKDYSEYLPWIIPHKRDVKKLYCTLTKTALNKIPQEIEKHVKGRKFMRSH